MIFIAMTLIELALHDPAAADGDPNVCRCATVAGTDGWCPKCRVGYYAGLRIESLKLFEVLDLHGHEVSAALTKCGACREAIRTGGFCDACQMGYIDGRGFFARVCYHLAKGRVIPQATPSSRRSCCPDRGGWCAACKTGQVGNRVFDDERDFTEARRFFQILTLAIQEARRCETCAMAIVCDSRCHLCRILYQEGKPVGQPSSRPASPGKRGGN